MADENVQSDDEDITVLASEKLEEDMEKGKAVKNQLALWDGILEARIKLQKPLTLCNQLPQPESAQIFHGNPSIEDSLCNCKVSLQGVLEDLQDLQRTLDSRRLDTRSIVSTPYRDEILEKWSTKLELATGKLTMKSYSHRQYSILSTIDHILKDKNRLRRRTQLKRASYKILGKAKDDKTIMQEDIDHNLHLKDVDDEIFDDGDFYHQLLKELINSKTSLTEEEDPVIMGRKWLELQSLKSKIKKNIDTKASKGRRLRYHTQQKLIGFMAPTDDGGNLDTVRNELFTSLFGRRALH